MLLLTPLQAVYTRRELPGCLHRVPRVDGSNLCGLVSELAAA